MYEWSYNGKVVSLQFLDSLQQATLSHTCLVLYNLAPSDRLVADNRWGHFCSIQTSLPIGDTIFISCIHIFSDL